MATTVARPPRGWQTAQPRWPRGGTSCWGKGADARVPSAREEEEAPVTTGTGDGGVPQQRCERGHGLGDGGSSEAELCVAILRVTVNLIDDPMAGDAPTPQLRMTRGKQPWQEGAALRHGAQESNYPERTRAARDATMAGQRSEEGQAGARIQRMETVGPSAAEELMHGRGSRA